MTSIKKFDYIIIGAGPAGVQLGYFLEKSGHNYLILEAGDSAGTFFKNYPRHKKLISINKVYTGYNDPEINLRWDWNSLLSDNHELLFKHYSRDYFPHTDALVTYINDFVNRFHIKVKYNSRVVKISRNQDFIILDQNNQIYTASRLIIATGFTKPYLPPIPGIEQTENYIDVSVNPEDFANQKVLIIGKGNSGFETADNLVATASQIHIASPHPISMAWKTKYVGHLRAINNTILDTYQLKSQNVIIDAEINQIEKYDGKYVVTFKYGHANGEVEELIYDRVITCTGFSFDASIFDESCRPELTINNRFPAQTSEWESINIKDLYFVGVLTHMRDFKKKQSGFIHGFRYNIRAFHQILEYKYHNQSIPSQTIAATPENLTKAILNRVNQSSALWQQTGFLCDLIVVSEDGETANYYKEIPIDYIHDSHLGKNQHYYTITLEFGLDIIFASPDPFAVERVHKDDVENARLSPGLHPIVRCYCQDKLISEHHVIEDIANEWIENVHRQPLEKYFVSIFKNHKENLQLDQECFQYA
ncbi:NAD(P)-binding domain-containing protein [Calothrix sp. NIES-3974]|uniref:NAD(P)-binding domain-containing protein n=1 Tax=Calothrix sp. NIES-3974 TaxID=2005462 RepID=UPI000B5ECE7B|nr:NAD(P)-binding domain-containing protein [Calothrix sp. NIES-3974]BAZ04066.1 FAD-dependent pyridine nucleotide-disulfide oxidoreductase [Calothrix sp. NIES-3974]